MINTRHRAATAVRCTQTSDAAAAVRRAPVFVLDPHAGQAGVNDNLDAAGAICEHAGEVQRGRCLAGAAFLIAYRDYPGPRVPVEGVVFR